MKLNSIGGSLRNLLSPSMRREWIEMDRWEGKENRVRSPSMRREWIEMTTAGTGFVLGCVSLHAEGVD